jgi:hypothetical protein
MGSLVATAASKRFQAGRGEGEERAEEVLGDFEEIYRT